MKRKLLLTFAVLIAGLCNAATITSNAVTGTWAAGTSWVGGVAPAAGDNAVIVNGAVITLGAAASITSVTVNSGGKLVGSKALTVSGTFTIQANGIYDHNN